MGILENKSVDKVLVGVGFIIGTTIAAAELYQAWWSGEVARSELSVSVRFAESEQKNRLLGILYGEQCSDRSDCTPAHHHRLRSEALLELQAMAPRQPTVRDLSGALLSDIALFGLNLSNFVFDRADLSDSVFGSAPVISSATDCDQVIRGSNLGNTSMNDTKMTGLVLAGATLDGAILQPFGPAEAMDFRFVSGDANTTLLGVFPTANLSCAQLSQAKIRYSDLRESRGIGLNLSGADLRETNFSGSTLTSANFKGSNLSGANFENAVLDGADFRGAILTGVNFSGTASTLGKSTEGELLKLLEHATIDGQTVFPEGFSPERHGTMIRKP